MAANTGLYGLPAGNRRVGTRLSPYSQALTPVMTTELNAIGIGATSGAGVAIDNTQLMDPYMSLELVLGAQTARTASAHVAVYAAYSLDGGNYADVVAAAGLLVAVFPLDAATTARRVIITRIDIDPAWFRLFVLNNSTQAFAATGNTLSYRTYGLRSG